MSSVKPARLRGRRACAPTDWPRACKDAEEHADLLPPPPLSSELAHLFACAVGRAARCRHARRWRITAGIDADALECGIRPAKRVPAERRRAGAAVGAWARRRVSFPAP